MLILCFSLYIAFRTLRDWVGQFSKRLTPFEGIWSDMFHIENPNGASMKFRGKVCAHRLVFGCCYWRY